MNLKGSGTLPMASAKTDKYMHSILNIYFRVISELFLESSRRQLLITYLPPRLSVFSGFSPEVLLRTT